MSSTSKKSSSSSKSVRFSAESKPEAPKRRRDDSDDDDDVVSHKRVLKKKRTDQMNEDEMDDMDDWNEDDEEDDGLPSIREREKAKRARRNNREHGTEEDDDDDEGGGMESTSIDERTSLASEGIQIEPFHMKQEQSDGTGFFDGDTYIFRKRDADEEPDAWLESLKDKPSSTKSSTLEDASSDDAESDSMIQSESLTKEEWYAKILNLVSDTETIMQAVIRYGSLLKRKPLKRNKAKKHEADNASTNSNTEENPQASEAFQFAQTSLNDLTEAANALLGMGDVDIYQKTRNDLLKLMPSNNSNEEDKDDTDLQNQQSADKTKPKVSWEYKGSQDGQIHGPYTSEQMRDWTQAGYFVGVQAVQIRSVKEEEAKEKDLGEDLLADLMDDDDDDDDDEDKDSGKQGEKKMVQGEWVLSDSVNFGSYC